jgi:hypothetical protein
VTRDKMKAAHAARREVDPEAMLMADRPEPRPEMRPAPATEMDSRARAAARAAQLLDHGVLEVDATDKFRVDLNIIPDGWTYEWKRHTTLNAEDPGYQVNLAATGWEPVMASRHPEMMPEGYKGPIMRDGQMLMERPAAITEMVKARDHKNALEPVRQMEAKLSGVKPGEFERVDQHGRSAVKVNRTYEHVPIPD